MNWQRVFVVTIKELTDGLRDRRGLASILIGTLIGPLLIGFMLNRMANMQRSADEIEVPVVGRENAPVLVNWLAQQAGVTIVNGPADPEAEVTNQKLDVVLVIPKEFPDKFRAAKPATVKLVSDSTRTKSRPKVQRLKSLLARYSAEIGSLRLIARGVSPVIATALMLEEVEVSSAQQRAAQVFGMIPLFLVLGAFAAGMQIATDSTAGERERGSLEPLLVNPVPRLELVLGKWLAAATAASVGSVMSLAIISSILLSIPLEDLGFRFRFTPVDAMRLVAVALPMALFAPSVQMYLASFAKSFKEAQSYMGYLIFLPMLPGMVSAFYPLTNRPWLAPVPILGSYALSNDVMGGRPPAAIFFVLSAISMIGLALIFVLLTTKLFGREKIIFGR
ncbi:MAG: ABC transporter permease [Bryobacteraceae bacterium]